MRPAQSDELPVEIRHVKTMLSAEELGLLYSLARDTYTGQGEIVDGGAFLGGSTLALATGLRDNSQVAVKNGRIHSYDLFVADAFAPQFLGDWPIGSSTRPYYDRVIAPHAPLVQVHEGDITTFPWPADIAIEILFIDIAKSWAINDFLLQHFFPRLIPGVSHVIQQDYHWTHVPWLSVTMELLADHVTYLGSMPWATAVYRWERPLEPGALPARLLDLGAPRLRSLAERAQRFERGSREWTAQQCNIVGLYLWLGDGPAAAALYEDTVATAPSWVDYFAYRPALPARA